MRFFLILPLMFGPLYISAQSLKANIRFVLPVAKPGSDTVYYDKALEWHQFTGKAETGGRVAALTSSGFGFDAGMGYNASQAFINVNVYCFFNKSRSWVKPDRKTAYILNHEQRHFDLSYIAALLFVQKLRELKFTKNNYDALLDTAYADSYAYLNRLQDQYDQETSNGINAEKQNEWNSKINALLTSTKNAVLRP